MQVNGSATKQGRQTQREETKNNASKTKAMEKMDRKEESVLTY